MKTQTLPSTELLLCNEVEIHYKRPIVSSMKHVTKAQDAVDLIRSCYTDSLDVKEYFWLILLNTANRALGISTVGVGLVNCCPVNVKEVMQIALLAHATGIILAHNHPSGNLKFSESDIAITKKFKAAGENLDIKVLDHIIITESNYFSFADENIL
mgnify:CR=1 FL=1